VRIGPSSAVAVAGFLRALKDNQVQSGDSVMIAIGEGARRSPGLFARVGKGVALESGQVPDLCGPSARQHRSLEALLHSL